MPHLVEFHDKYGPQGLVILAITQNPKGEIEKFVKENKINYRVGIDEKGEANRTYPTTGIPQSWLIGADGTVLYKGHPGSLQTSTIEDSLKKVVDLPLREVVKALQTARADADRKKYGDAWTKARKVLADAKAPEADKADAQYVVDEVKKRGEASLAVVDEMTKAKRFGAADQRLKQIAAQFNGTEWGKSAGEKQKAIESDPDGKKDIEAQRIYASLLAQESGMKRGKEKKSLIPSYEALAKKYDGTETAKAAKDHADALGQLGDK